MDKFPVVPTDMPKRRQFLRKTLFSAGAVTLSSFLVACGSDDDDDNDSHGNDGNNGNNGGNENPTKPPVDTPETPVAKSPFAQFSTLQAADRNGVMLPEGFTARIVARSSEIGISSFNYAWHPAPDGGACYETEDGGWIYVSNSEVGGGKGGVGALRFNKDGQAVDAYRILGGTNSNCAGGKTPWGTWLSCEETATGLVHECDPKTQWVDGTDASLPALGAFAHEAVAVDPAHRVLYLTEDDSDKVNGATIGGRVYRFVCSATDWPAGAERPQMRDGTLQVLEVVGAAADKEVIDEPVDFNAPQKVRWVDVVDPDQSQKTVRATLRTNGQTPPGAGFIKAEGIWFFNGIAYFTTSYNHRVWAYDTNNETLEVLYNGQEDNRVDTDPEHYSINEPDNITVSVAGDILVAEDSGNLEISVLRPDGTSQPVMRLTGQDGSEITGPALSPDGSRLYFSSQRGIGGGNEDGITYEILLPFPVTAEQLPA